MSSAIVTEPKQVRLLVAETQQPTARAAVRNGCCCLLTHEVRTAAGRGPQRASPTETTTFVVLALRNRSGGRAVVDAPEHAQPRREFNSLQGLHRPLMTAS